MSKVTGRGNAAATSRFSLLPLPACATKLLTERFLRGHVGWERRGKEVFTRSENDGQSCLRTPLAASKACEGDFWATE